MPSGIPPHATSDVLVIGAGPAGLMAALVLRKMGLRVRIIDRRMSDETSGQAGGIQPRMLEIWQGLGIGESLRQQSEHIYRIVKYGPNQAGDGIEQKGQALNIPLTHARYQYEILARIDIIEGILRDELFKYGVRVEYTVVPSSMEFIPSPNDDYPVKMTTSKLDEILLREANLDQESRINPELTKGLVSQVEHIATKFVVGCDGGKSWTRKQLDIAMEGTPTDLDWGVVDFTPVTDFPTPRAKNILQSPTSGGMGWLPRPNGAARAYVMLGEQKEMFRSSDPLNTITKLLQKGFAPYKIEVTNPTLYNIFRVSQLVADKFSGHGRVFIAGDACHTHSPKAGQGANASMSDTFNLAWKIGYVVKGWAKQDILETYEEERRPHSIELIELDRKIFKLFAGQIVSPEEYTNLWQREILFTSGIGLRYLSALIDEKGRSIAGKLVIGERLPSVDIVRTNDWRPYNIHDVASFDGKYHIFVLPGDMLAPRNVDALRSFSQYLLAVFERRPLLKDFIQMNILIDNDATQMAVETMSLPLTLVQGLYDRVFFTQLPGSQGLYQKLQLEQVAFITRPDNHVAAVTLLDEDGASSFDLYFSKIIPQPLRNT